MHVRLDIKHHRDEHRAPTALSCPPITNAKKYMLGFPYLFPYSSPMQKRSSLSPWPTREGEDLDIYPSSRTLLCRHESVDTGDDHFGLGGNSCALSFLSLLQRARTFIASNDYKRSPSWTTDMTHRGPYRNYWCFCRWRKFHVRPRVACFNRRALRFGRLGPRRWLGLAKLQDVWGMFFETKTGKVRFDRVIYTYI